MKKLTVSKLVLLILFAFSLTPAVFHTEQTLDGKVSVITAPAEIHEDLPAPDSDEKKTSLISQTITLILSTQYIFYKFFPEGSFSALFAFLTTVYFQANYMIKPIEFRA